jgi:hypothetical protein
MKSLRWPLHSHGETCFNGHGLNHGRHAPKTFSSGSIKLNGAMVPDHGTTLSHQQIISDADLLQWSHGPGPKNDVSCRHSCARTKVLDTPANAPFKVWMTVLRAYVFFSFIASLLLAPSGTLFIEENFVLSPQWPPHSRTPSLL